MPKGTQIYKLVLDSIIRDLFDRPLINNTERAAVVERFVWIAGGNDWRIVSGWDGWDLEHSSGFRLEVKQSAARQIWTDDMTHKPLHNPGRFDIAPRQWRWDSTGNAWIRSLGRQAHGYVMAWHGIAEADKADHRNPDQWEFFVVASGALPKTQKSIGLGPLKRIVNPVQYSKLGDALNTLVNDNRRG